jgi:hypothetical protein
VVLVYKVTAFFLFVATGVAFQGSVIKTEPRRVEISNYKLRLEEYKGKCALKYEGVHSGQISMDLVPPCEFVRESDGSPQHFEYKNKKRSAGSKFSALLVVGGPIDTSRTDSYMRDGCGTKAQAVSVAAKSVVLGAVGSGALICPSDSLDEKMFGFLAKVP